MKRLITSVACLLAVAAFTTSQIAYAQNDSPTTQPRSSVSKEELNKRIKERKERLKTRLDNNQFKRITERCSGVQGKLNSLTVRFENSDKPYRAKYDNYLNRLEKLQAKLKENNVDTTKLDENITVLKQKITALNTAIDEFKTALNDAKGIDCKNDATGFKAALDETRTKAQAVKTARDDLQSYAKTQIRTTIREIKANLKTSQDQN